MIQRISISIDEIQEKVEKQCAQDFRGLRILKPEIDTAFEDFVLTADDSEAVAEEIKNSTVVIYQSLRDYICQWYIDSEVCFYINTNADYTTLEQLLKKILISSVLAWWYNVRVADLSASYLNESAAAISQLVSTVTPKFATRKLRMF